MSGRYRPVIDALLMSPEPSVRWKVRVNVMGENPDSPKLRGLGQEIRHSLRVRALLSRQGRDGRIASRRGVYDKWQGAHWVLAALADIGYPPGDRSLFPARDDVLECWLSKDYFREFEPKSRAQWYQKKGVPVIAGRHRRCASQQGNVLHYLLKLGLDDPRGDQLAERLIHWQWPDGGWNCDKRPAADTSSFHETLLPLRGLALHARLRKDKRSAQAAQRAAKVFLKRRLFRRQSDGRIINPEFLLLRYPAYWHYNILDGLKAMAEAGHIRDPRCREALDLLESKQLPDGGWPAEKKYYTVSDQIRPGADYVDWGGTGAKRMNPFVTVDALYVLKAAGRVIA
ncbi:MAG: hypothetical protein QME74_04370 [Candidatus Edwardsbacteria bacterium]|nr:hypothetical protein [Candidatus Edwardsbacteria bacterium]